jgi:hypothetical protein
MTLETHRGSGTSSYSDTGTKSGGAKLTQPIDGVGGALPDLEDVVRLNGLPRYYIDRGFGSNMVPNMRGFIVRPIVETNLSEPEWFGITDIPVAHA